MRQSDGTVSLVDVLTASARGAIGIGADVLLEDLDLDRVVDHGRDPGRGEACVAPRVRIVGRDPDEAVDAALGLEPTISILAQDLDRGRFYASLFARTF